MQLTLLSVATALAATASAGKSAVQLNKECNLNKPHARIINRCDYDVNIWSVWKNIGCENSEMVTLKKGEIYSENYQHPEGGDQGVSIKVSKNKQCTGSNIVQLEYFLETRPDKQPYWANYLDVSYVDCLGEDCPTKSEGYYLQAGTPSVRAMKATADNSWCPVLACHDAASCAKMSYILPDDVQTKTCDLDANMDFYMCGSHAPGADDEKPAPKPESSKKIDTPTPKPSTTAKAPSTPAAEYKVNAAAVTPVAEIKDKAPKVKTKVVYVTAYEYVNAKRSEHVHAHARRHQAFRA
ncbi:hypothetical protein DE146DRAFT_760354 [Phaeosphaeria sp. MPI-PUGE-AT-0046c]|nr:hypothetical protein DE146DRAFT_760354 [Phaeosphaeria sp. MPI-PUGE-AT-0046c]